MEHCRLLIFHTPAAEFTCGHTVCVRQIYEEVRLQGGRGQGCLFSYRNRGQMMDFSFQLRINAL